MLVSGRTHRWRASRLPAWSSTNARALDAVCQAGPEANRQRGTRPMTDSSPKPWRYGLTYEQFWQRVRESGWNPSPDELRALLQAQKEREAGSGVPSIDQPPLAEPP